MLNLKDPAARAAWVYGQPMAPCPKCGSYNMKPQIPIAMETSGDETAPQLVDKWVKATKAGATPLQGPAYYACWDCFHKGPGSDQHQRQDYQGQDRGTPGPGDLLLTPNVIWTNLPPGDELA